MTVEHPLRRTLRRAGLGLAVGGLGVLCALVVSACGSSSASSGTTDSTSSTTTTTGGTTTSGSASFTAYQSCLKAHGVTSPGGGFGGGGFFRRGATGASGASGAAASPPTSATGASGPGGFRGRPLTAAQQKALSACASLRPTGGGFGRLGGGAGGGGGGGLANNPAFAKFQTCLKNHGVTTGSRSSRTSSKARTAFQACSSLLPQGGFGGGGFGGPGGATGATGSTGGASGGSFQALQNCLKAHGVQTGSAGSQSASKTAAAIATCRAQVLGGGSSSGTPGGGGPVTTTPTG